MNACDFSLIVLIDSDIELYKALNKILGKLKFTVKHASTGSEGLQLLRDGQKPGMILIADNLRDIAASEFILSVLKLHPTSQYGIITNSFNHILIETCKREKLDNFFFRPLNIGQLITRLRTLIQNASQLAARNQTQDDEPAEVRGLRLEAETFFTIKDISESGCCLRSPIELKENDILVLSCVDLSRRLSLDETTSYPFRVAKSRQTDSGKYFDVGGQFIGLPPEVKNRLRSACMSVKGFKVSRSNG